MEPDFGQRSLMATGPVNPMNEVCQQDRMEVMDGDCDSVWFGWVRQNSLLVPVFSEKVLHS